MLALRLWSHLRDHEFRTDLAATPKKESAAVRGRTAGPSVLPYWKGNTNCFGHRGTHALLLGTDPLKSLSDMEALPHYLKPFSFPNAQLPPAWYNICCYPPARFCKPPRSDLGKPEYIATTAMHLREPQQPQALCLPAGCSSLLCPLLNADEHTTEIFASGQFQADRTFLAELCPPVCRFVTRWGRKIHREKPLTDIPMLLL